MLKLRPLLHMSPSGTVAAHPDHPPVPQIASLQPNFMEAETTMRVLVNGSGFTPQSSVRFDGDEQATEFVNAGQLAFEIEADEAGEYPVTVVTPPGPGGGGGESNALTFEVHEAPDPESEPTISSLEPNSTEAPARSTPARRR
jgi:IPT/TIG domain-containing protein